MSVTVWVNAPGPAGVGQGSVWTPIGEAGYPRVLAGSVHLEADDWGPSQGSLVIDLESALPAPLLAPWAKVFVEIDGTRCWSGYILDAQATGRQVAVSLAGTQMHLDDAVFDLVAADNRLSMWSDDLAQDIGWCQATANNLTQNAIQLKGGLSTTDDYNAVTYLKRPTGVVEVNVQLYVPQSVTGLHFGVFSDLFNVTSGQNPLQRYKLGVGADRWSHTDISTSGNYTITASGPIDGILTMGVYLSSGSDPGGTLCKITGLVAFDKVAYAYNAQSILRGSDLASRIADMVPTVSADLSGIQTTPTSIPAFAFEQQSPRQLAEAAAAFDDAIRKVDAFDRLVFTPRPVTPAVEVGAQSPPTSETPIDPSVLISGVVITTPLTLSGFNVQPQQQTQTVFFSVLDLPETPRTEVTAAPLLGGVPYQASLPEEFGGDPTLPDLAQAGGVVAWVGDRDDWPGTRQSVMVGYIDPAGMWWASFMPDRDWTSPGVVIAIVGGGANDPVDLFTDRTVYQAAGLFAGLGRIGTLSLPVMLIGSNLIPQAQTYLRAENRLGYTQERSVADGQARDATSGLPLPAFALLAHADEPIRLADRIDPQDGKVGALGTLTAVAYDHDGRRATLSVGQRYGAVDQMLARLQAKVKQ